MVTTDLASSMAFLLSRPRREFSDCLIGPVVPRIHPNSRGIATIHPEPHTSNTQDAVAASTQLNKTKKALAPASSRGRVKSKRERRGKTATQREKRRSRDLRYRDKQQAAHQILEQNVRQLQSEVACMKRLHHRLAFGKIVRQDSRMMVAKIFGVLEGSFRAARLNSEHTKGSSTHSLKTSFSDKVATWDLYGATVLTEQLKLFGGCFEAPNIKLQRVDLAAPGVIVATATICVAVSESTLSTVAPFLNQPKPFLTQLLGRRLSCNCAIHFLLDEQNTRVEQLETTMDLMKSLLQMITLSS